MTDITALTNEALLDVVREAAFLEDQEEARAELLRRLAPVEAPRVLPQAVIERIRSLYGPGSRTFDAMEKRILFAFGVWDSKYGPLTPEQAQYAEEVVLWALDEEKLRRLNPGHSRALAYTRLDRIVNHEHTAEGFKSRAGYQDFSAGIAEALS